MIIKAYRDDELFSEHVIEIVQGERAMEIREIRNYLHYPTAFTTCLFEIYPQRYVKIDMQMRRGELRASLVIDAGSEGSIAVTHNGEHLPPVQRSGQTPLLFDGPSLMFDWVNAIMMLGICDGETMYVPVNVIDIRTGGLIPTTFTFRRTDNLITIGKGIDVLTDSEIVLHREDFDVDRYRSGGCDYHFPERRGENDEE